MTATIHDIHRTVNAREKSCGRSQTADTSLCCPLYRLTSKTYPGSTSVNYTYDILSRLTQVTAPSGIYSFGYDNVGRLLGTGTQYPFLGTALNNSYGYDADSNRVSFSNPQSQVTSYTYDSLNRLTGLSDPNTGSFGFGYDADGRRTSLTRPNGVNTAYTYDTLSRLLSIQHAGGALPGSTSYTYDAVDNCRSSTGPVSNNDNASNKLTLASSATFTCDNNGNTAWRLPSRCRATWPAARPPCSACCTPMTKRPIDKWERSSRSFPARYVALTLGGNHEEGIQF